MLCSFSIIFLKHCNEADFRMRKYFGAPYPNNQDHHHGKNCTLHDIDLVREVYSLSYSSPLYKSMTTCYITTKILHQSPDKSPPNLVHKLLHKSFHQTTTKVPLIRPQTLTIDASTSSSLNSCQPNQDLKLIYILKLYATYFYIHTSSHKSTTISKLQVMHKNKAQ